MQALVVWGHLNCYIHILVRLHHKQLGFLERMKKLCRTEGYSLHVPKCLRRYNITPSVSLSKQ